MTTPQFIEWLDGKMAAYHKLVPPPEVLESELHERIESKVRAAITERILREAGFENQVATAIAAIEKPDGSALAEGIEAPFRARARPRVARPHRSGSQEEHVIEMDLSLPSSSERAV